MTYLFRSLSSLPFPIPETFPALDTGEEASHGATALRVRPRGRSNKRDEAAMVSSLSTSIETCEMIRQYASALDHLIRRRTSTAAAKDVSWDDLRELSSDLWGIHDNYAGEQQL